MLQDMIHPPEQHPMENVSSPISTQIFEFCDQELFPETLQNSEVSSCSNCCYEENSYSTNLSFSSYPSDMGRFNNNNNSYNTNNSTNLTPTPTTTNLSIIFDCQDENDNDISASINFSPPSAFSVHPLLATNKTSLISLHCNPKSH